MLGAGCLILAMIAMQVLPFSWVGVLLLRFGAGLLIAEGSIGVLFLVGLGCLLIGGVMLFDRPDLSDLSVDFWRVLVPIVVGFGVCAGLLVFAIGRRGAARAGGGRRAAGRHDRRRFHAARALRHRVRAR